MPLKKHEETRVVGLPEAWKLLASEEWEIVERYQRSKVRVGRPRLQGRERLSGGMSLHGPDAAEGVHGVQLALPSKPNAGASWFASEQEARAAFADRLAMFAAQTTGAERVYCATLVIDGAEAESQFAAVGEIAPDRIVLDGLSLTYIGVLVSIALALAFGIQELSTPARFAVGFGTFFGLAALLKVTVARRLVVGFARWALPGAHEP